MENYQILGLLQEASTSEIRFAYKKLLLKFHPDKSKTDTDTFLRIQKAYEYLTDPNFKQSKEDRFLQQKQYSETIECEQCGDLNSIPNFNGTIIMECQSCCLRFEISNI